MTDFSNRNWQNHSFVKQDLENADFSNSDLRGCNFSGANLQGANFSQVITGRSERQQQYIYLAIIAFLIIGINEFFLIYFNKLPLIIGVLLVAVIVGFIPSFHPMCINYPHTQIYISEKFFNRLAPLFIVFSLIVSSLIQGKYIHLINLLIVFLSIPSIFWGGKNLIKGLATLEIKDWQFFINYLIFFLCSLSFAALFAQLTYFPDSLSISLFVSIFLVIPIEIFWGKELSKQSNSSNSIPLYFISIGCLLAIVFMIILSSNNLHILREKLPFLGGLSVFLLTIVISTYGKVKHSLQESKGTSFRWANLTAASFMKANLSHCDFLGAKLTEVNWQDVKIVNCRL